MKTKVFLAAIVILALCVPTTASANNSDENLAYLTMDRVDRSLAQAQKLFKDFSSYNGEEVLAFRTFEMTSLDWLKTGVSYYEKAWDGMVEGKYREAVRFANLANDIFKMLLKESKDLR